MIILSICIPTYNGEKTIDDLLSSIVLQTKAYLNDIEIVISDDKSIDKTISIVNKYIAKRVNIKLCINEVRLGMDHNFTNSAKMASGKYVWFCGQDDIFCGGAISKFFDIISKHDVDFIYFNYKAMNGNLTQEVAKSRLSISNPYFIEKFFPNHNEYFKEINHVPTFLPATIMRKKYWDSDLYEYFIGSFYVQVGVWLLNFENSSTYVVGSKDYIICRNPEKSWKYEKFPIMASMLGIGRVFVHAKVDQLNPRIIPNEILEDMKKALLIRIVNDIIYYGLDSDLNINKKLRKQLLKMLKTIFIYNWITYNLILFPLYLLPSKLIIKIFRGKKHTSSLNIFIQTLMRYIFKPSNISKTTN